MGRPRVRDFLTSWWCIRNLTCSLRSLVQFLIQTMKHVFTHVDSNRFTQYLWNKNNVQWPNLYCQNHQRENPDMYRLDKVWFVLEIRLFTFPYFPAKSSWSINNRYRRLFLFQRDRADGGGRRRALQAGLCSFETKMAVGNISTIFRTKDRWLYEKSNLKLT